MMRAVGAVLTGLLTGPWMWPDNPGQSTRSEPVLKPAMVRDGHPELDYGSEGWGFESLRACASKPMSIRWLTWSLVLPRHPTSTPLHLTAGLH